MKNINIICVKWGDRYSFRDVNLLKKMIEKNTTLPFHFICLTDDSKGIDNDIETLYIKNEYHLERWWNKMYLFKPNYLPEGKYVYFDLDIIIQNNIDELLLYDTNYPCFVERNWDIDDLSSRLNSSVISWKTGMTDEIWDVFITHIDEVLLRYKGLDGYINFEEFNFELFPDWFYSYMWGTKDDNYTMFGKEYYQFNPNYKICLLNGYYNNLDLNVFVPSPYEIKEFRDLL